MYIQLYKDLTVALDLGSEYVRDEFRHKNIVVSHTRHGLVLHFYVCYVVFCMCVVCVCMHVCDVCIHVMSCLYAFHVMYACYVMFVCVLCDVCVMFVCVLCRCFVIRST